jgi:hypothetical protein
MVQQIHFVLISNKELIKKLIIEEIFTLKSRDYVRVEAKIIIKKTAVMK